MEQLKKMIVRGAAAAAGVGLALAGAVGTAWANPDVVNLTYADASTALGEAGLTPKISVVVGDLLPVDECLVTSARTETALRPSNDLETLALYDVYVPMQAVGTDILLSLNCNGGHATLSSPGNSLLSPEGREALAAEKAAAAAEESELQAASTPDE